MGAVKTKRKRAFGDHVYKTYDPEHEGYGSSDDWRSEFRERMGLDEAKVRVGSRSPRAILGVGLSATWDEIRKAYRKKALEHHPDRGGSEEEMKRVNAAFTILERDFDLGWRR